MTQRILIALMYAVGIVIAAFEAQGIPTTVEGWIGLVIAFVGAFWAKFATYTRPFAMNRAVWTPEKRATEADKRDL
jgi:hypothetical protein